MSIAAGVWRAVVAHGSACRGREVCGLLFGDDGARPRIHAAIPLENRSRRADRFAASAEEVWQRSREQAARGRRLLGVYHSHPDAAPVPSDRDRAGAWGELLQLIVSTRGAAPELACWVLDAGSVRCVELEFEEGAGQWPGQPAGEGEA